MWTFVAVFQHSLVKHFSLYLTGIFHFPACVCLPSFCFCGTFEKSLAPSFPYPNINKVAVDSSKVALLPFFLQLYRPSSFSLSLFTMYSSHVLAPSTGLVLARWLPPCTLELGTELQIVSQVLKGEGPFSRAAAFSLANATLNASWFCWKGIWLPDIHLEYQDYQLCFY